MRSTKIIKICSSSLCTCLHHMVILRTRNKITDFFMILAWASPFNISPTSSHLHPIQVENCDSNSWLVVDEEDNGKFKIFLYKHRDHYKCLNYLFPLYLNIYLMDLCTLIFFLSVRGSTLDFRICSSDVKSQSPR